MAAVTRHGPGRRRRGAALGAEPPGTATHVMLKHASGDLAETLMLRSTDFSARGRLAETLYGIALDLVARQEELATSDARRWVGESLYEPVGRAADAALRTLADELAQALLDAPETVRVASLQRRPVSRLDFE